MREKILEQITSAIEKRSEYFLRENDIQLYLANHFSNSKLFDKVFMEYHVPSILIQEYPWKDKNKIYIDIVLSKDSKYYPIEIKYKTRKQQLTYNIFGQKNKNVFLGHHLAKNIGCYDFWKDVKRIELFERSFPAVKRGIVLFISNDLSYKNKPKNLKVGYANFSVYDGRIIPANEFLKWNGKWKVAKGRPNIRTIYSYSINWKPMLIKEHYYAIV
jgi:hypothetical protein